MSISGREVNAQCAVAVMYAQGMGVAQDYKEALDWFMAHLVAEVLHKHVRHKSVHVLDEEARAAGLRPPNHLRRLAAKDLKELAGKGLGWRGKGDIVICNLGLSINNDGGCTCGAPRFPVRGYLIIFSAPASVQL